MAATSYENFKDNRDSAKNRWETYFVTPYGSAYNEAYHAFMDTFKKQEEADKADLETIMQLALFALSLCGGSILTHVFGSAILKEVAAKVAVDTIINRGMERSFRAAAFIERNKTAQFALGELWGKAEGWIGDKLKDKMKDERNKPKTSSELEEFAGNYLGLSSFGKDPLTVQNSLSIWVGELYEIILNTGTVINNTFDGDVKSHMLKNLSSSLFITCAPTPVSNPLGEASIDIELTFFMKYILDLDYKVQGEFYGDTYGPDPFRPYYSETQEKINASPTRVDYPVRTKPIKSKDGGYKYQDIRYIQAGDIIRGRINELYKKKFGSDFFKKNEKISRNTLARAEMTLNMLEGLNHNKILKTLTKIK
jgi:hypothetical protein